MSIQFQVGHTSYDWTETHLKNTLQNLQGIDKHKFLILKDLQTKEITILDRIKWWFYSWFTNPHTYFNIDLEHSKEILKRLQPIVEERKSIDLQGLFFDAIRHFDALLPRHLTGLQTTHRSLDCHELTDEHFQPITRLWKDPKSIQLKNCDQLTDIAIGYLVSACPNLYSLEIIDGANFTSNQMVEHLTKLPLLEHVFLPPHLRNALMETCPQLKRSNLFQAQEDSLRFGRGLPLPQVITYCQKHPELELLDFSNCNNLSQEFFEELSCPKIKEVNFDGYTVRNDAIISFVKSHPTLERISIRNKRFQDELLPALKETHLKEISYIKDGKEEKWTP